MAGGQGGGKLLSSWHSGRGVGRGEEREEEGGRGRKGGEADIVPKG